MEQSVAELLGAAAEGARLGGRALGGRVGLRFEPVEVAFRALDFNVGPALFLSIGVMSDPFETACTWSDGSVSLALSVVDRRLRFNAGVTQYYEDRRDGSRLTMTMPSLGAGVRIDPGGPTQVWIEGGAAMARIKGDPAGDSSLVAPTLGSRVVHALSPRTSLLGAAEGMFFPNDVRALGGRVGLRFEHVEVAFRALDFNVGPALFGPELGVGF